MSHVYLLKSEIKGVVYYKIGMTKGVKGRVGNLNCASPFGVTLIDSFSSEKVRFDERYLHELFQSKRVNGEWFELTPDDIETFERYGDWVESGRTKVTFRSEVFAI